MPYNSESEAKRHRESASSWYWRNRPRALRARKSWRRNNATLIKEQKRKYYLKYRARFLVERKSPRARWQYSKRVDQTRGLATCDLESFVAIVSQPCRYCGFQPKVGSNGADRIDNAKGHEKTNIVSACWPCNRARGSIFSFEEMKLFIGPAIRQAREHREKHHGTRP